MVGSLLFAFLPILSLSKFVSNTITFNDEIDWRYISKFAVDVGKGEWTLRAKLITADPESIQIVKLYTGIYLDDTWDDVLQTDECKGKRKIAKRNKFMQLPKNGDWSTEVSGTLSQRNFPHVWYFSLFDCDKELGTGKQRVRYELTITNVGGSHFSKEDEGLQYLYPIALLLYTISLSSNLIRLINKFKRTDDLEPNLLWLNVSVGCIFCSLFFHTLHTEIYAFNGNGFIFFDFMGQMFEAVAQLSFTILLLLMATGWTIKYKEFPDTDIFIPITVLVVMIHLLVIGLGRITDDQYYKFSDMEGVPGIVLIVMRLGMWGWFLYSSVNLQSQVAISLQRFTTNFIICGSMWFLAMPGVLCFSWLFKAYYRNIVVIVANLIIETLTLLFLSFLFSEKSSFYKKSTMSQSVLPGKIN